MKIAFDISQIVHTGSGVARFTQGLIEALIEYNRDHQLFFLFYSLRRELDKSIEKKIRYRGYPIVKIKLPPTLMSFIWNDLHLYHIDNIFPVLNWYISSDWIEPPAKKIKKATIVHDVIFLRYPDTVSPLIRKTQRQRLNWVKTESQWIFTDTNATKQDLIRYYAVDEKRIVVNYPAIDIVLPASTNTDLIIKKYHLNKKFFLAVGKLEPRKNINRLVEAFSNLNQPDIDLVIIGPKGWGNEYYSKYNQTIKQYHIKFLGLIPDTDLYALYSQAEALIFPSLWEGFGYPLLEAMRFHTPIICSNIPPFREVAGEAALYFNPNNTENITKTIDHFCNHPQVKQQLINAGDKIFAQFSWRKYYNTLIKTLNSKSEIQKRK